MPAVLCSNAANIRYMRGTWTGTSEVIGWTIIADNISASSYTDNWGVDFDSLNNDAYNYIWVRVSDKAGNQKESSSYVFYVKRSVAEPQITDNIIDGDTTWRKINDAYYDVDFSSNGPSTLAYFQTIVYSTKNWNGSLIDDWRTVVSDISSDTYNTDWQIKNETWDKLPEGKSWVSLRVFDTALNVVYSTDTFYIYKDTHVPVIDDNQTGDFSWRRSSGTLYNIGYTDTGQSLLNYAQYRITSSTGHVLVDWYTYASGISSDSYTTGFKLTDTHFTSLPSTYSYVSVKVYDYALNVSSLTNAFFIKKDTAAPVINNSESGGDDQWRSVSKNYNIDFSDDISFIKKAQYTVYRATDMKPGEEIITWSDIVSSTQTAGYTLDWPLNFDGLEEGVTNWVSVRCYDWAGTTAALVDAFYVRKDTTPPLITDLEDGDTVWRNVNEAEYKVDFSDTGGSELSYFQTRIYAMPYPSSLITDWQVQKSSINSNSYTQDWKISTQTWKSLVNGNNYITIEAWDNAGNSTQTVDVFNIFKDTAYPVITNYEVDGDTNWINSSEYYNIDFTDAGSWLGGARYTVYSSSAMKPGTEVIGWKDIIPSTCTEYTDDWEVLFSSLTPGYNYVSIKAFDHVANTTTVTDAFFIKKDTSLPVITNNLIDGDTTWRRINSAVYNVDFYDIGHSSISYFETRASTSPAGSPYLYNNEWEDELVDIDSLTYTADWPLSSTHWSRLKEGVTNYISVRVVDLADNTSSWINAFYVLKDTTPPVINDLQDGDTIWRRINNGSYNITYNDTGGSNLEHADYKIVSCTGPTIINWYTYVSGISSDSYTTPISIENSHFTQINSSCSYVLVRVYDTAGSTITSDSPVFYIKKDTVAPVITDLQDGDTTWRNTYTTSYNVDFEDTISLLNYAEYRIWTDTDGLKVDWTTPPALSNLPAGSYTADWQIEESDFNALLPNSTSYVDVRVYDNAGSTDTALKAFYIRKDTIAPSAITDLAGGPGTEGEINLSWTVTGDDNYADYIENGLYEIRYTTDSLDVWATADYSKQIATSTSAGNEEGHILTGLVSSTTYYIWIKIRDKADNWSGVSNTTQTLSGPDNTPPARITDLEGAPGDFEGQVELTWTAPGDNDYTGIVSGYTVKYTTYSNFNWVKAATATWNSVGPSVPASSGTVHTAIFAGLNPDVTYWWSIKAYDEESNYSVQSNTVSVRPTQPGARDAMLVLGEGSLDYHKTKVWGGGSWSSGANGDTAAATIRWTILRSNNNIRNEKMAGILSSNNNLYVQKYDGVSSTWTNQFSVSPGISAYRCFDISYEQNTGRCLVVYYNGTAGEVSYRLWSSTASAWVIPETALPLGTLTGAVNWVRLEPRTGTNEIMLAAMDANNDMYAYRWNGTSFVNGQELTTGAQYNQYECFDLAWETQSGDCIVLWGEANRLYYDLWNGSVWGGALSPANLNIAGSVAWVRVDSDPSSDNIGFTCVDAGNDWNAGIWDGSQWLARPTEDAAVQSFVTRKMDCAWEKDSGKFFVLCAGAADRFDWCYWKNNQWYNASSAIGSLLNATLDTYDFGTAIMWLQLKSDPNVNKMIVKVIESGDSIKTRNWNGSNWTQSAIQTTNSSDYNYECGSLETDRHDDTPPILSDYQSGDDTWRSTNSGYYNVDFTDSGGSGIAYFESKITDNLDNMLENWTAVVSGINSDEYSINWQLLNASFDNMREGTNKVYVRVYDGASNVDNTNGTYCFYVKKDTAPAVMTDNQSGDYTWRNSTGMTYNVDFSDPLSYLDDLEYSVYPSSALKGTPVKSWTPAKLNINQQDYSDNWEIDFISLYHGTSNWVSARIWDRAGNYKVYEDVFVVWKDTLPPNSIANLTASIGQTYGQVELSWAAPGDDGVTGDNTAGSAYRVRYSTAGAIDTEPKWDNATEYSQNWPVSGQGQTEEHIIVELDSGVTYWFAVKTRDKVSDRGNYNWSGLSNAPAGIVSQAGNLFINEVYAYGGAGGDWIEFFNDTGGDIDLTGWKVDYYNSVSTSTIWTGDSIISSGTFLSTGALTMDHSVSGRVSLYDTGSNLVSYIKYPVFSEDASVSRIYNGSPYLCVDLRPTKGFTNTISTHPVRINEVKYGADEFIELYNAGTDTVTLSGCSLRNKNKVPFIFTRKILPKSFTAVDHSSIDNGAQTYNDCFGLNGLDSDSDFVMLETPSGKVIDMVTWQGSANVHYNKNGSLISYVNAAPSGVSGTVGRTPSEGKDTDVDSADFTSFASGTLGSRNNKGSQPSANVIAYPAASSVLPRNFRMELALSTDSTGGYTDTIWFIRTSGDPDLYSPHIYTLSDLGFDLSDTSVQISTLTGISSDDIDGYNLSTGTVYRMILNSDRSDGSAGQIILDSLTYDTSIHSVSVFSITPSFGTVNEGLTTGLIRIDITNSSPESYNSIEIEKMAVTLFDGDSAALSTEAGRNLFNELYVVFNSTDYDNSIGFQPNKDTYTGSVSSSSFSFSSGRQIIPIANPDSQYTTIAPQETMTYFVAVKLSSAAADYSPSTFSMTVDGDIDVIVRESASNVIQDIGITSALNSGNLHIIEEVKTDWANISYSSAPIYSQPFTSMVQDLFMGSDDGKLRAINSLGTVKWTFNAPDKIRTNIFGIQTSTSEPSYLYFADNSGNVYKLRDNGNDYTQMWSKPLTTTFDSIVVRDYVYAPGADGNIRKLGKDTGLGAGNWDGGLAGSLKGFPAVQDGWRGVSALWVSSDNGKVYRVQLSDGIATSNLTTGGPILISPTLDTGYYNQDLESNFLFIGSTDGKVYCRVSGNLSNIPDGWKNRSGQEDGNYNTGSPIMGGIWKAIEGQKKYLYFGNDAGRVYKIDASSGTMPWPAPFQAEGKIRTTPVLLSGYVYFGDTKGYYYAVSASDGITMRNGYPLYLGAAVLSNPTYDSSNKRLYIGTEDGRMHAINIGP
ncbi:MAG: lamin tail domain-containing protein [Elusimicrobiota bacterium]